MRLLYTLTNPYACAPVTHSEVKQTAADGNTFFCVQLVPLHFHLNVATKEREMTTIKLLYCNLIPES